MAGPGVPGAQSRRLPARPWWDRLRRPADRRARQDASRELRADGRAGAHPPHRSRLRRDEGRARRGGARPRGALPVRARRRAGRARLDGPADSGGVRRRGRRHRLIRDRDRGADAHRLVRGDHRGRAHLARDDADPPLRQRGAEAGVAAAPGLGPGARCVRADRAGRRLGCRARRERRPSCATASG